MVAIISIRRSSRARRNAPSHASRRIRSARVLLVREPRHRRSLARSTRTDVRVRTREPVRYGQNRRGCLHRPGGLYSYRGAVLLQYHHVIIAEQRHATAHSGHGGASGSYCCSHHHPYTAVHDRSAVARRAQQAE